MKTFMRAKKLFHIFIHQVCGCKFPYRKNKKRRRRRRRIWRTFNKSFETVVCRCDEKKNRNLSHLHHSLWSHNKEMCFYGFKKWRISRLLPHACHSIFLSPKACLSNLLKEITGNFFITRESNFYSDKSTSLGHH